MVEERTQDVPAIFLLPARLAMAQEVETGEAILCAHSGHYLGQNKLQQNKQSSRRANMQT